MKILFLTTYNVSIQYEHFFTINVWKHLAIHCEDIVLATILCNESIQKSCIEKESSYNHDYYTLMLPIKHEKNKELRNQEIANFFSLIGPSVIHSNMIEGYDVEAAQLVQIPIVLTIHIGGLICPRGGGNGFLMYNNQICNTPIGQRCLRCCCMDLPFPHISYLLQKLAPDPLKRKVYNLVKQKNRFYLTPFLLKNNQIRERLELIHLFQHTTIIAANKRLVDILKRNGLYQNIELLPHGVEVRDKLALPSINQVIKFFYLGRIQYSKGLHLLLEAFRDIATNTYELHIIGDAESSRKEQRYYQQIKKQSTGLTITFHGRVPNNKIESLIQNYHVMVHPTICLEVYGINIAESLSMGRPVLATKCGGAEMQIENGVNGWLVEPNSSNELKKKILSIIQYPKKIEQITKNCKTPHPIENYILSLNKLYLKISK